MRHPPFKACADGPMGDLLTYAGAKRAADRIAKLWAECGYKITPQVVPMIAGDHGSETWAIRLPELVNGLPPETARIKR